MAGNREGGLKAAKTTKKRHGKNFYKGIGANGGKLSNNGGFASELIGPDGLTGSQRASLAGAKGGKISRRPKRERG